MLEFIIKYRRVIITLIHVALFAIANYAAFLLRFENIIEGETYTVFLTALPFTLFLRSAFFYFYNLHRGLWRYVSIFELGNIFKAVCLSSLVFSFFNYVVMGQHDYPRSVIIIDSMLLIMFSGGLRLFVRVYQDSQRQNTGKRVLIYGAGCAGEFLLREITKNKNLKYRVVGFIDDNLRKKGLNIQGYSILGNKRDLKKIVAEKLIEEVVIAIPSATSKQMRFVVERCKRCGVAFTTIPGMGDIMSGKVSVSSIRSVNVEDLLFRKEVKIDHTMHQVKLEGKTVMVTGAAGSIGSELVRQISKLSPRKLILFDQAESNLFFRDLELKFQFPNIEIVTILGDVLNFKKLENLLKEYVPQVIFHAAAYKHVPMLEVNPAEAIKVNITGTKNLSILADKYGVDKFVFISTDKAVNPSSVMGASKRIAELFIKEFSKTSMTRFIIVRFGNVLGSDGSIIPIIKSQIVKKGSVTITHPDIKRFFMTIPEAVSLVIQAGYMGKGGEVFLLKMGEQIKILDLAKTMISLSGFTPYEDIKIVFTGLRAGEKLYEELYYAHETVLDTVHLQIQKAVSNESIDGLTLNHYISQLEELSVGESGYHIHQKMKEIVPTFNSPNIPELKKTVDGVAKV